MWMPTMLLPCFHIIRNETWIRTATQRFLKFFTVVAVLKHKWETTICLSDVRVTTRTISMVAQWHWFFSWRWGRNVTFRLEATYFRPFKRCIRAEEASTRPIDVGIATCSIRVVMWSECLRFNHCWCNIALITILKNFSFRFTYESRIFHFKLKFLNK